jgi:Spy/CpxP family protein refolding chaperone
MNSSPKFTSPASGLLRRGLLLGALPLLTISTLSVSLRAQDATPPAANTNAAPQDNGNGNGGRQRRNFSPDAMMAQLKTRFGVLDDAEWAVISARITPIMDLRRTMGGGGGFGGFRGGGGGGGRNASPEVESLRSAITDNLPDAEIKARLDHLREARKADQAKLEKAQADLVAVLTVKQEAIAVMMGILP